jgi:AAA+ ATPase superfamily predicted ATPase
MIGRTKEIDLLKKALTSKRPELIAVIGRRRDSVSKSVSA